MIDRNARPASRVTPGMRQLLAVAAVAWVAVLAQARPAAACVRASETNRVLGWTADGAYALLGNFDRDGVLEHAEILDAGRSGRTVSYAVRFTDLCATLRALADAIEEHSPTNACCCTGGCCGPR